MRTRNFYFPNNSSVTISRRRNKRRTPNVVEPELRTIVEVAPMADNRTMEELLQALTEGNKPTVSRMNTTSMENASKTDDRIDKLVDQISTLVDIFAKKVVTLAPVKAVEESCVTCGGPHAHYNCDATNSNQLSVCVATGTYNQVAPQNRTSNYMAPPGFAPVQNSKNRFNQNQGQGNNFNRGNNFHGNQHFQVPNQGFQNQPFQVPNNPVQQGFSNEFLSYKKVNDQILRNMQNQINSLKGEFKNEIQNTMKTQQTVLKEQQNAFQNNLQNMLSGFFQNQGSTSGTLPSNTIPNPKGEKKAITTRSSVGYEGPLIPTNPSPKKVVKQETEETTDREQTNFQGSTAHIQPSVILILEPDVPKTLPEPNIPYPSRLNDQKLREKATNQMDKFFQIFQDSHFDISFADALLLMPKFASMIKRMDVCYALANLGASINLMPLFIWKKPSLPELTPTRMTLELANLSITRPKGVPKDVFIKVRKFHFLTDFVVVDFEADPRVPLILGRSFLRTGRALINVYGEEITLRSKSKVRQSRAKAVVAKVSTSSSTPAISSEVSELKDMVRALLLDKKNQSSAPASSSTPSSVKPVKPNCVTCSGTHSYQNCPATSGNVYRDNIQDVPMPNLKSSIPYPSRRDNERRRDQANEQIEKFYEIFKDMSLKISFKDALILMPNFASTLKALIGNKEKLSEMTRTPMNEHYTTASGNLTPSDDPIVSTTSLTLTPFGDSDFLLFEEADAFLGLEDDPNSPKFNPFYYDPEGNILLLEAILNSKPLPPLPNHKQYMPLYKKELKVCEAKTVKSFVDEPPEVELKDLPPHLEYVFLEGDNKLPVIISKELGDEEKSALITILKSHKRAIVWKLSDIQGINPEFYTHKILMEEDYKPVVQHQRRVNPKIHDVIKK
nr:hypothetical protein [Tanacetum cinerariifolium]